MPEVGRSGEYIASEHWEAIARLIANGGSHTEPIGDGNATFIEPMTDSEFADWIHENEQGWGKIYDKFLGRNHGNKQSEDGTVA